MNAALPQLSGRLEEVRGRIAAAAKRSGREARDVELVAVVKSVPAERVREAVVVGLQDLAENRVQDAEHRIEAVGRHEVRWHMVGHLQRNKASRAVALFDRIHSLDDLELAQTLSRRAVALGRRLPVLVQVNVSGEASKHGVAPEGLLPLLEQAAELPGIAVDGLMSIGPTDGRGERARPFFARTRELRDSAERALGSRLPVLSMGMSDDYETAIEEGSTMVRLGTALFGPRD